MPLPSGDKLPIGELWLDRDRGRSLSDNEDEDVLVDERPREEESPNPLPCPLRPRSGGDSRADEPGDEAGCPGTAIAGVVDCGEGVLDRERDLRSSFRLDAEPLLPISVPLLFRRLGFRLVE